MCEELRYFNYDQTQLGSAVAGIFFRHITFQKKKKVVQDKLSENAVTFLRIFLLKAQSISYEKYKKIA